MAPTTTVRMVANLHPESPRRWFDSALGPVLLLVLVTRAKPGTRQRHAPIAREPAQRYARWGGYGCL